MSVLRRVSSSFKVRTTFTVERRLNQGCICQISTRGSAECEARRAESGEGFLGRGSIVQTMSIWQNMEMSLPCYFSKKLTYKQLATATLYNTGEYYTVNTDSE